MKQLFIYLMIRMTTRHALTAVKIYEGIFLHNENDPTIVINNTKIIGGPKTTKPVSFSTTTTVPKNNNLLKKDQKKELVDSLSYLKSKQIKSKQDKSSISMLEGLIASMK